MSIRNILLFSLILQYTITNVIWQSGISILFYSTNKEGSICFSSIFLYFAFDYNCFFKISLFCETYCFISNLYPNFPLSSVLCKLTSLILSKKSTKFQWNDQYIGFFIIKWTNLYKPVNKKVFLWQISCFRSISEKHLNKIRGVWSVTQNT